MTKAELEAKVDQLERTIEHLEYQLSFIADENRKSNKEASVLVTKLQICQQIMELGVEDLQD